MQKGSTYEEFIAKEYAKNGYDPIFHRDLGKSDQKIDLILTKAMRCFWSSAKTGI